MKRVALCNLTIISLLLPLILTDNPLPTRAAPGSGFLGFNPKPLAHSADPAPHLSAPIHPDHWGTPIDPATGPAALEPAPIQAGFTVDPLATSPSWTASGEAPGNHFGWWVRTAGDVNGDGYDDVIVGAPGYSGWTGRVYVYRGGPWGLSPTPAFTATGEAIRNQFGSAAGTAGDVNGDGYDDVIVGAGEYSNYTGRAYVFHGGASGLSPTPAFTATGEASGDMFGFPAETAGDVNGDGYDDVIVGAAGYMSGTGRVYVYHGEPGGLSPTPAFTATGEGIDDLFGYLAAGTAGNVNGDGYDDVIVGAAGYMSDTGRVYVYHGEPGGLSPTPAFSATGEASGDYFGWSVGTAGNVNGDGYDDVIVGAFGYGSDTGRVYAYQGGLGGLSPMPAFTATGEASGNHFGWSVGTAGNVNGDGYDDVIVGAAGYMGDPGRAYVYHGKAGGLSLTPAFSATGEATGHWFGISVGTARDVNGDGYDDIIVGAYNIDYNDGRGQAYAYHGGDWYNAYVPVILKHY